MTPEIGTLPVNDSMQVTVEFTPQKTGDHLANLVLHYDTGENKKTLRQKQTLF